MNDFYVWLLMQRSASILTVLCVYGNDVDAYKALRDCMAEELDGEFYFIDKRPVW